MATAGLRSLREVGAILGQFDGKEKFFALSPLLAAVFGGALSVAIPAEQRLVAFGMVCTVMVASIGLYAYAVRQGARRILSLPPPARPLHGSSERELDVDAELWSELSNSYGSKKAELSPGQRGILEAIEKCARLGTTANQKDLEEEFDMAYVYWRLEHLRLLGFVSRLDTGERRGDKPVFCYRLSRAYSKAVGIAAS